MKILVVDKDEKLVRQLERGLSSVGLESVVASQHEQALNLFGEHQPSLVLLRADSAETFWPALCADIRERADGALCPIFLIGTNPDGRAIVETEAQAAGADEVVSLPLDEERTLRKILAAVGRRSNEEPRSKPEKKVETTVIEPKPPIPPAETEKAPAPTSMPTAQDMLSRLLLEKRAELEQYVKQTHETRPEEDSKTEELAVVSATADVTQEIAKEPTADVTQEIAKAPISDDTQEMSLEELVGSIAEYAKTLEIEATGKELVQEKPAPEPIDPEFILLAMWTEMKGLDDSKILGATSADSPADIDKKHAERVARVPAEIAGSPELALVRRKVLDRLDAARDTLKNAVSAQKAGG